MKKNILFGLLVFYIGGCADTIVQPVEKLGQYEVSINLLDLKQRRDDLIKKLPANSLVIITTNDLYIRNGDNTYDFRPSSSFYYLTGFEEPNSIAIIRPKSSAKDSSEMIMFVEQRNEYQIRWLGSCYGPEGAVKYFNADLAYTYDQFKSILTKYLNTGNYSYIYSNLSENQTVSNLFYSSNSNLPPNKDINLILNEMRVIKSEQEIKMIQKSTNVTLQAFSESIKRIKPGIYEYEIESELNYILKLNGCARSAFTTIIASGPNINTIHYSANNRQMQNGDLVMIDFGAEYGYYASDITRTLPVNGKFSSEQKIIYDIVLEAYNLMIFYTKPGATYSELSEISRNIIIDRMLQRGIISGDKASIITNRTYTKYIPAGFIHSVGLDEHDPFPRSNNPNLELKENMVFAYEPHIYLLQGDESVTPKFRNISVRIEDIILITNTGNKILSKNLPIESESIEQLMKLK
jgi:Xaa-Pro aminopeptidase